MVEPDMPGTVGGNPHGVMIPELLDPTVQSVVWINMCLAVVVLVVVVVDFVRRGRYRNTSIALTRMLAGLAPLLGVSAAANCLFEAVASTRAFGHANAATLANMAEPILESLAALALGAGLGAAAVVITAILRLAPVHRPPASKP